MRAADASRAAPAPRRLDVRRGDAIVREPSRPRRTRTAKTRELYTSVGTELSVITCMRRAGTTATNPVMPAISPNLEFASTNSVSVRTTDGTSADFDTRYDFCSTSAANTSGNRARSSMKRAINSDSTTRATATIWITSRRPPAMRSITGPTNGRDQQERGEADHEEEEHLVPCRGGVDAEEQRVGKGDEHHRVAAGHRCMRDRQATELRRRSGRPRPPWRGRAHAVDAREKLRTCADMDRS